MTDAPPSQPSGPHCDCGDSGICRPGCPRYEQKMAAQPSGPSIEEQIAAVDRARMTRRHQAQFDNGLSYGANLEADALVEALATLRAHEAQSRELAEAREEIERLKEINSDLFDTSVALQTRLGENVAELARLRAPSGRDAMEVANSLFHEIWTDGIGSFGLDQGRQLASQNRCREKIACAITAARAETEARFRPLVEAAKALYDAHCHTHKEREAPTKFGMNYGELNDLHDALAALEEGNQR